MQLETVPQTDETLYICLRRYQLIRRQRAAQFSRQDIKLETLQETNIDRLSISHNEYGNLVICRVKPEKQY